MSSRAVAVENTYSKYFEKTKKYINYRIRIDNINDFLSFKNFIY